MDWGTHVVLAYKALQACDLEKGAAVYANLPAIDSKPPEFHRVYAHIIENMPTILDAALDIFGSKLAGEGDLQKLKTHFDSKISELKVQLDKAETSSKREIEKRIYAYTRILEESPTFLRLTKEAVPLVGDSDVAKMSSDKLSAGVSLISHIYFDTFNNPVQAFLPYSSLPAAHWDLWDQVDYMKFREDFYKAENINKFRKQIADDDIWDIKLKPGALIKAMIIRNGEQGRPAIPYESIDWVIRKFLRYMNIVEYQRVDKEVKFLRKLEERINEIIINEFPREESEL